MNSEIHFVVPDSLKTVFAAAGISFTQRDFEPCPLAVGDVICSPAAPGLFFRVAGRLYRTASREKPGLWVLTLEAAPNPLDSLQENTASEPR